MNATHPINTVTIHHACRELRCRPSDVRHAVEVLGIAPAMLINGVPYFAAGTLPQIAEWLDRQPRRGSLSRPRGGELC